MRDGSRVVLKIVRRRWTEHAPTQRRLAREYHIARGARHPGLIAVRARGMHEGAGYLVLQDHPNGALTGRLASALQMDRRAALGFVRSLAEALHCLHSSGVVHLDVKPANILVDRRGRPVLTDHGLARFLPELQRPRYLGGTPGFMSPEQASRVRRPVDHRSDLFSLGTLLYALYVGDLPYPATTRADYFAALEASPTWPADLLRSGGDEILGVLSRALAVYPEDRHTTAQDMADELGTILRERRGS